MTLESKMWFRIMKVIYIGLWIIGLLFGLILTLSTIDNINLGYVKANTIWYIPLYIILLWIILETLKKTFYYIALGKIK